MCVLFVCCLMFLVIVCLLVVRCSFVSFVDGGLLSGLVEGCCLWFVV